MTNANTLLLRLEGPLQAWGTRSRWRVRETGHEPTKSGVLGLLGAAMRLHRAEAPAGLPRLRMGVRADREGVEWEDYHTVGAGIGVLAANGRLKRTETTGELETVLSTRLYLCDASFLVALMPADAGDAGRLEGLADAVASPGWPLFLGRKSCPPAVPVFAGIERHEDLLAALAAQPWRPRLAEVDEAPARLRCVLEVSASDPGAEVRHDELLSLAPPRHGPRYVREEWVPPRKPGPPVQTREPGAAWRPMRYDTPDWDERRRDRLQCDGHLCVFCKRPARPVHHVSYARRGAERPEDLRSLCRLCHDAISMLESEYGLGTERLDPLAPRWRDLIRQRRDELLRMRVLGRLVEGSD